jgi:hypothetical protein
VFAPAAEQKLARQARQRKERAEARKEKRHLKAEAKRARKANVQRAAKWNDERKAADKVKKAINRPDKREKRRRRMLLRADKLEAQAKKLMIEAQKARARFAVLTELKEVRNALSLFFPVLFSVRGVYDWLTLHVSTSNGVGSWVRVIGMAGLHHVTAWVHSWCALIVCLVFT